MNEFDFNKVYAAIKAVRERGLLCSFGKWGKNNPRKGERQYLYGDVMDWLRDMNGELELNLNLRERSFVATHLIGEYVVNNNLL